MVRRPFSAATSGPPQRPRLGGPANEPRRPIYRRHASFITSPSILLGVLSSAVFAQPVPYSLPGTAVPVPLPASLSRSAETPVSAPEPKPASATVEAPEAASKPSPGPGTLNSLFNSKLPEAIGNSRISLDARLRWEHAEQQGPPGGVDLKNSDALTLRTRFGLTTAPLYHFQAMLEGENIAVLGPRDNYNAAGSNGEPNRAIIADPPTTELNQAWISYSNWDTTVKAGRQRIVLDNHRFIGDVGWRQNMQTYDAIGIENHSLPDFSITYAYLWDVHRVFGDVDGLPAANRDFDSDSHAVHLAWSGWKYGRVVGYAYLLDLDNASPASHNNSTATYGGYFAGSAPICPGISVGYRAEFAWQTDYGNSPLDYQAEYYNVEAGASVQRFAFGAGYEVLGTDNGQGFKTPLATLHAFNGWADVFLNTPGDGLRDVYAYAQARIGRDMPLRFVFHQFDADAGGNNYGQEYDVLLSRKLGMHWSALAKYAHYIADAAPYTDVNRFWLEATFNY